MTIRTLPDEALLEVFHFYVHDIFLRPEVWIPLAHVCRRWRYIVFASPLRLNLSLNCKGSKPAREMLDTWPRLPIVISDYYCSEEGADNIIAALEHNDRVCGIDISIKEEVSSSVLGRFAGAIQEPFPKLTDLTLRSVNETTLVVPETFLGGSAPRLRSCQVDYIPFPALRKLLLSASHLVHLRLEKIPHSVCISPEAMVTCLSAATNLESLVLGFQSPRPRPDHATQSPPPLMRTIIPALTYFRFHGVSEYLEDFISRFDAPLLHVVNIRLFHQLAFDALQLHQFISRTETFSALTMANVDFEDGHTSVEISSQVPAHSRRTLRLSMRCDASDWQLSFLARAFSSLSPTLSTLETLTVRKVGLQPLRPGWEDDMENDQWLELFDQLTSVKSLYLSKQFVPLVAPALQQLESVTDVLPGLQNLYLEGHEPSESVQEGIGQFIAARQCFSYPVTVEPWHR